jgi:hypothetical protein
MNMDRRYDEEAARIYSHDVLSNEQIFMQSRSEVRLNYQNGSASSNNTAELPGGSMLEENAKSQNFVGEYHQRMYPVISVNSGPIKNEISRNLNKGKNFGQAMSGTVRRSRSSRKLYDEQMKWKKKVNERNKIKREQQYASIQRSNHGSKNGSRNGSRNGSNNGSKNGSKNRSKNGSKNGSRIGSRNSSTTQKMKSPGSMQSRNPSLKRDKISCRSNSRSKKNRPLKTFCEFLKRSEVWEDARRLKVKAIGENLIQKKIDDVENSKFERQRSRSRSIKAKKKDGSAKRSGFETFGTRGISNALGSKKKANK